MTQHSFTRGHSLNSPPVSFFSPTFLSFCHKPLAIALFLACWLLSGQVQAQLTGTKTVPGDYATVAAAVDALNLQGVGAGGVTFNVAAGHTETSDIAEITATGTVTDPVVFQKSGVGANPLITRLTAGTVASSTTLGSNGDGIIIINGGDYLTFDGIDVQTNPAFTGVEQMEYGYFFKKASDTDASKNVTIKNCSITLDKTARYSFGIYVSNLSGTAAVTVASEGGRSENIKIFNNNISNCYGGIQLRGFLSPAPYGLYDQGIEIGEDGANTITDFGGGASTAYGVYAIYQNNLKVNNNNISGGIGTTTTGYGVFISTANNSSIDINNNTISVQNSATTSLVAGIGMSIGTTGNTSNTLNVVGNTLTNFARQATTSGATYFIYSSSNGPVYLNIINNTISNSSLPGTGIVYGINQASTPDTVNINNNTISNITRTATTSTSAFYGINCTGSSTALFSTVSGNTIHSLMGNGTTGDVGGIIMGSNNLGEVFNNKIYNITSDNASGEVNGISIGSVANGHIYNNLISGLNAPNTGNSTAVIPSVRGINITSTLTNSTLNLSYNTVLLEATSTGANFGSAALFSTTSATATSAKLVLKNNIFVNNSVPNGVGLSVAYQRSSTTITNYGDESNNNLFYAGTPDASHLIFFDDVTSLQTIGDFKLFVAPRESSSVTENVDFLSNVGSSADFLHIDAATPTQVESGGVPIAGITTDFDGVVRNVTTPDMGADEGDFIGVDLTGPSITYTDVPNSICVDAISLSVDIVDPSLVNTTGGTKPRLWFKKATEMNVLPATNTSASDGWKWVEATNAASPYTFDVDYSLLASAVTSGDVIEYFVVAQDLVGTPNVGTNAATYNTNPTSVALGAGAFPVSGTKTYMIIAAPVTIGTQASPSEICISGDVTLTLVGDPSTGATYQWQSSPAGANTWADIVGATTTTYMVTGVSADTDFRAVISCGGVPIAASPSVVATVDVSNPEVLTTTPGAECGPGPVSVALGATGSIGATLNWYDVPTGGTSLASGTTFNTPAISSTTTYYVGASDGGSAGSVGPLSPAIGTSAGSSIAIGTQRMFFDVLTTVTINTVDIFPTAAIGSNGTVTIRNSSQVVLFDIPFTTTVTGGAAQTITLNVTLAPGTDYEIGQGTTISMLRNSTGAVYPYTSTAINITSNTFNPVYYYWYYNWQWTANCESARTPVVASIESLATYYQDSDMDTYGNAAVSVMECGAPAGYVSDNTDCNDAVAAINPGATEVCNTVDDDCDMMTDEGVTSTFYADTDMDTYGDLNTTAQACTAPVGFVANSTDCNDSNAAVNPGATEVCNTIDDDCDMLVDEGVTSTFYADTDMDTYGDLNTTAQACTAPVGFVDNSTDCNDGNAAINPGAAEICDNIDNDCSGAAEAATTTWTGGGNGTTWDDAANWSDGIVPLTCQNVVIPVGADVTVPAGFEGKALTLDVATGALLTVTLTALLTVMP